MTKKAENVKKIISSKRIVSTKRLLSPKRITALLMTGILLMTAAGCGNAGTQGDGNSQPENTQSQTDKNHINDVHAEKAGSRKGYAHNYDGGNALFLHNSHRHIISHRSDHRAYTGLHSCEHLADEYIFPKDIIKY